MPKVVDPDQRRQDVFDALFTVIVERGVHGASLRRVAERAGLAIGSVRHYFDSHEEMLCGAAREVVDRITERLMRHREALERGEDRFVVAERMLFELLALDERSTRETVIWLEFTVAARIDPALRETAEALHTGVRTVTTNFFRGSGLVPQDRIEWEAERLAALLDGLALARAMHPSTLSPQRAKEIVRGHLAALGAPIDR